MIHGGNIYEVAELLNKNPLEIIDLSASVNPLPLPLKIKQKLIDKFDFLNRYPDTHARTFRKTLSGLYGIPFENIICGNGSTELIYLVVKALNPKCVLILEPTFIEYERACRINKIPNVERIFSLDPDELVEIAKKRIKTKNYDLVFVCNPNNPTGWLIKKEEILTLVESSKNTVFIVDEAFIDFSPDDSILIEAASFKNLVVLRSLTKFYGLAGLRFGYAVGSREIIEVLGKFIQPWSINTLAETAAEEIIKDKDFRTLTQEFFTKEKEFFENSLKSLNIEYLPSVANFYLIKLQKEGFAEDVLKKGIIVRDCSNFYGLDGRFIRVSIKIRKENEIFLKELERWKR